MCNGADAALRRPSPGGNRLGLVPGAVGSTRALMTRRTFSLFGDRGPSASPAQVRPAALLSPGSSSSSAAVRPEREPVLQTTPPWRANGQPPLARPAWEAAPSPSPSPSRTTTVEKLAQTTGGSVSPSSMPPRVPTPEVDGSEPSIMHQTSCRSDFSLGSTGTQASRSILKPPSRGDRPTSGSSRRKVSFAKDCKPPPPLTLPQLLALCRETSTESDGKDSGSARDKRSGPSIECSPRHVPKRIARPVGGPSASLSKDP